MDRPLILAATLALAGCVPAVPAPGAETAAPAAECPPTMGGLVLEAVNEIRIEHGLAPLAAEARLARAALDHTMDQARQGERGVGHVGSDGSSAGERADAAGYRWRYIGENVGAGIATPQAIVAGWMNSASHRATILAPEAVHAGVGYVNEHDGRLNHYWTLVVAAPQDGYEARVGCHP